SCAFFVSSSFYLAVGGSGSGSGSGSGTGGGDGSILEHRGTWARTDTRGMQYVPSSSSTLTEVAEIEDRGFADC
ncbi:hypothetical protein V1478_017910, partial [Vespula squamosa]